MLHGAVLDACTVCAMDFKCPVCHCSMFDSVIVSRPDGESYKTSFFRCAACTLMFMEPELFTAAPEYQTQAPTGKKMAWEVSALRQALTYRYWQHRLKRENGGIDVKSERVQLAIRKAPI